MCVCARDIVSNLKRLSCVPFARDGRNSCDVCARRSFLVMKSNLCVGFYGFPFRFVEFAKFGLGV